MIEPHRHFCGGYPNSTKLLTKISLHQHLVAVIRMFCKSLMNSFEIQWILMWTFAKQFGIRTEKLFSKIYASHINTDIYNYVKHLWGTQALISPALAGLVLLYILKFNLFNLWLIFSSVLDYYSLYLNAHAPSCLLCQICVVKVIYSSKQWSILGYSLILWL